MVTKLNKDDHDAIQKRRKQHEKTFKKELEADKNKPNVWREIFSMDFLISNLAMVISWIGLEYLVRKIIAYVSTKPQVVLRILKFAGIYGVIAGIGLIGIVFIVKEYQTIKALEKRFKAGKLNDLEGKPIKGRKRFLEAVVFSTVGVKNAKVEKFVDHLLKVDK